MGIYFYNEGCSFTYKDVKKSKKWLLKVLQNEKKEQGEINIIFTNNPTILNLNKTYLSHNYFTDVIAFNYGKNKTVSGDIYISLDTVKKNAETYHCSFMDELHRVMVHGLLHLVGYNDKTKKEKAEMLRKEEFYLSEYTS